LETILITGANGQIGTELTHKLLERGHRVIATDVSSPRAVLTEFEILDVQDELRLKSILLRNDVTQIYHLAAILSARGEQQPTLAWQINVNGSLKILDAACDLKVERVFMPSSIAVFGDTTPKINTPQYTSMEPATMYGVSKVAGELLGSYYYEKKGLDVRSLRYPGLISYKTKPGGGTTDYAIEIFHAARTAGKYTCFLNADTRLPMMYMPDALRATLQLMDADRADLTVNTAYNLAAISFTPAEIAAEIQKHIPSFTIEYVPDFREQIARSWSESIDDSAARTDWNWQHEYDLSKMTADMLANIV
jgi:nucleoside-diphosphate-sugar epimerase